MPVVCQCRRIRARPGAYGMRQNRLLMRVIVPLWTRLDLRFLTRNEQASGSSPLVDSPFCHCLQAKRENAVLRQARGPGGLVALRTRPRLALMCAPLTILVPLILVTGSSPGESVDVRPSLQVWLARLSFPV